jgi:type II secretory pathway component PulF
MAEPVTALALATWARQFSTLINAGVSLMRSLAALQETAEEPLASITRDLSARVEAGALCRRPWPPTPTSSTA